jgi:hypothetical protein
VISEIHLPFTTAADGSATATASVDSFGRLVAVNWEDGDLADGVGAVLSCVGAGRPDQTLLTLTAANDDAWHYPTVQAKSAAGAAITWYEKPLVTGKLKVVVSSGGNAKTGSIRAYVER